VGTPGVQSVHNPTVGANQPARATPIESTYSGRTGLFNLWNTNCFSSRRRLNAITEENIMNRKLSLIVTAAALLVVSFSLLAQNGPANRNRIGVPASGQCAGCGVSSTSTQTLTDDEKAWLLFMREEEKLARDVYQFLGEKYNLRIFANIAQSEQRHFDAIYTLIKRYGLDDPSAGKGIGEFTPESGLQAVYNSLIAQGSTSVVEALKVGVTIEKLDIEDLKEAIVDAQRTDIIRVYSNLLVGSERHLDAFESCLEVLGVTP